MRIMLQGGIFISFTILQRVTLQDEFIFAYAAVKIPRGVLRVL